MQDSANRLPFSPPSSLAAPQLRVGGGEKLCGTAPNFKPGSSCSCYQQAVQTDKVRINARWERGLVFLPTPTNREHRYLSPILSFKELQDLKQARRPFAR